MSEKREGTFIVDGMLEGHLPATPGVDDRLREWADKGIGPRRTIRFSLDLDGGRFNLLADNHHASVADLAEPVEDSLAFALEDLFKSFPPGDRAKLYSTLRSIEYRPRQEVQTLYTVGPQGRVHVQQQIIAAATTAPPESFASPHRRRQLVIAAAVILAVFAASTFFVDYRHLFSLLMRPPEVSRIALDNGAFAVYFTVENNGLDRYGDDLNLRITRTAAYPLTDDDFDAASTSPATHPAAPAATESTTQLATQAVTAANMPDATQPAPQPLSPFRRRLALDTLARGYIRFEYFNDKNEFIGSTVERIADLGTHRVLELSVRLPHDGASPILPQRIVITY